MDLLIREATEQDIGELADLNLMVHAWHVAMYPDIFRSPTRDEIERLFREWMGQENFRVFVAIGNGQAVGYIGLRIVERPANIMMRSRRFLDIEQIGVQAEMRGKGIGWALLDRARAFAREKGLSRIELNVWSQNADARRSFGAWGFRPLSERMSASA